MEQNAETATSYYNDKRKRSFFLSRIFVIVSMVVLVAALGVNISVLYQQQRTSTTSEAASENKPANLPDLPKGCEYQSKGKGVIVVCPTAVPEVTQTTSIDSEFPVNVRLPKLPAQCDYINATEGLSVTCSAPQPPIPTVAVNTDTSCVPGTKKDVLNCTDNKNQSVAVPLPSLPEGCGYILAGKNYFVDCNDPQEQN